MEEEPGCDICNFKENNHAGMVHPFSSNRKFEYEQNERRKRLPKDGSYCTCLLPKAPHDAHLLNHMFHPLLD